MHLGFHAIALERSSLLIVFVLTKNNVQGFLINQGEGL